SDHRELRRHENRKCPESRVGEAVAVQTNAKHVRAEPAPARDDVARDGEAHEPALLDHAAPTRMEDDRVPDHDEQCSVLLRIPAPEATPGLIRPDAAQHGAGETEERRKAD